MAEMLETISRLHKIPSYLAKEVELSKRHDAVMKERVKLLEEMRICQEQQVEKMKNYSIGIEAAGLRNLSILQDLKVAERKLKKREQCKSQPMIVNLEDRYWESIEEELPKWEQFLLGKTPSPFGIKQEQSPRQKLMISQTMQTPKVKKISSSGSKAKTFSR
uniref:Centrosomal protein 15 n=1 Tax=Leptobrachium leishanense TaxID=445787 RepID=A0A8C5Q6E2_9ANUR